MNKYFVIGNPINHSLSPTLHNYWIKINNINAIYEKKKLETNELKNIILEIKERKIFGINVTVPFKKEIIKHLNSLTPEAENTQSVNTIYLDQDKVIGHNTDINGFELAIKKTKFDIKNKRILILGAGGVVPSIIYVLKKMGVSNISVTNRTTGKAENLKNLFKNIDLIDWGVLPNFDMVINATSVGLNMKDEFKLDFSNIKKNTFFYDVIYNPKETKFLEIGKKMGCRIENGKMMFIYQASASFKLWHGIEPAINDEIIRLLD